MALIDNFGKVHFDFGAVGKLGECLAGLGIHRPLLLTDQGLVGCGVFERVENALPNNVEAAVFDQIPENPTVAGVVAALTQYEAEECDGLIAVGGGSVIDSAKAVALLSAHPGPLQQYVGHPEMVTSRAAPIIAVPTTAGTGSEVTRGGGIHPNAASRGFGIGGDALQPKLVICDPELTLTLPPGLTAGTGMDALSHAVEGFLSPRVNPPVDAIALDCVRRVKRHIERAVEDGSNRHARWQMMMAALEGGMAISKGLGPAHAIAIVCGDTGLHHGTLVTVAMPAIIRFAADAVSGNGHGNGHGNDKMSRLAEALDLPADGDVAAEVERLNDVLGLPCSLRDMGYEKTDVEDMATAAEAHYFNTTAPRRPSVADYKTLLGEVLG